MKYYIWSDPFAECFYLYKQDRGVVYFLADNDGNQIQLNKDQKAIGKGWSWIRSGYRKNQLIEREGFSSLTEEQELLVMKIRISGL